MTVASSAIRVPALIMVAILLMEPPVALAQLGAQEPTGADGSDVSDGGEQGIFQGGDLLEPGEGLEAAISGGEYRLGPGDVLLVNVWGGRPVSYRLPVTLEGKLLIPNVGVLEVNQLLLADAKEAIRSKMLEHFRNTEVSVTLVGLRSFQIHVLGQVRRPGTYIATGVERVSSAVTKAGGLLGNASQRRIRVQNGDSLRTEADLLSFYGSGIVEGNPRLQDGDLVYVPFKEDHVVVRGEVNRQGSFEFLPGDRLSDIFRLTGGFTTEAYLDTMELARYGESMTDPRRFLLVNGGGILPLDPEDGPYTPTLVGTYSPRDTDIPYGVNAVYPDFELAPEDFIFVRQDPKSRDRSLVDITGEVRYPGAYPIDAGETRLSEIIAAAGGLTHEASLPSARLIRRASLGTADKELERLSKISRGDMSEEEYEYVKLKSREHPGRMVVDFRKALEGDPSENLILFRGDLISIPSKKDFVSVLGTVVNPGNVIYRPGLTAREYVDVAGGFAREADEGKSRVVKVSGEAWLPFKEAGVLEAGDVVLVPEKKKTDYFRYFTTGLTITLQILTIWLIIDSVSEP